MRDKEAAPLGGIIILEAKIVREPDHPSQSSAT
jgi:hypothetical protein